MRQIFFLLLLISELASADDFFKKLANAALERSQQAITYDSTYYKITYPNGDVPAHVGVCTDVVIRSYRALNIDLQSLLHQDLAANFARYPSKDMWGLTRPDTNIDHRRVPNLQVFFSRHGQQLKISKRAEDYRPGDLVTWTLPGNLPHIGIVSNEKSADKKRLLIVHNIGQGPKLDDMLFDYPISGHYRYQPL